MSDEIFRVPSLSQMFEAMGMPKPMHPLVGVIDIDGACMPEELIGRKLTSEFYTISMKDGGCGMQYGRNHYDFEEGVLSFTAPNQVITVSEIKEETKGWMLVFHPDLVRKTSLGQHIDDYTFFSYEVYEALHLSEKEEEIMDDCIDKIRFELEQNIDAHSESLLASNIELLLNYSKRFYERQFHTRSIKHKDVVTRIDEVIRSYYTSEEVLDKGSLSIQYLAEKVNLSANYMSDMLKRETGKNAKEHINDFVVEEAKNKLLNSAENISEIGYSLGFNYPHYFSRMFKSKTGMTPNKYRDVNLN